MPNNYNGRKLHHGGCRTRHRRPVGGYDSVQLAIIRGLSQNHPRSAQNIIRQLREEAALLSKDNSHQSLASLPARYLLSLLDAKPPNVDLSDQNFQGAGALSVITRLVAARRGSKDDFA